ncbi:CTP synthase C-terminal region-related (seleno)protein [Pseudomonas tohonis]|uniref:CTP synthase C-terminal region-related (seleno)protein n=1 Tax=Pseudomonas tohonis TaxID=2725477 RepID=UPI001F30F4AD|nr:CTP synthase [Pseudomonas tohonis]
MARPRTSRIRLALIGDQDLSITAHQAIPEALSLAASLLDIGLDHAWLATDRIDAAALARFDGFWCVPGSPYRDTGGALRAIEHARGHGVPFLGTCGGFQHALLEYARNVLGWADAEHGETAPDAGRQVVAPLACSLVEAIDAVHLAAGSRIARAYGAQLAFEGYRCRYGLNPQFEAALLGGPLRVGARDATGEVRAVELEGHPFFVATLFQPERAALAGRLPALVAAFVATCAQ